ncbi:glycosyltransferase family 9 protein [Xanthomarina gelatinilytica]|uniref:glycosyltransferase family 9 protein n=1 Tax=Xanthomarina gelatinilytica TaxID=1137281 RepID=UPI0012DDA5BE|nr:glycosyltransferase family 9 protein [Xanthomarina gelatinilytica]
MTNILFLHDTSLSTPRGAELTINQLISHPSSNKFQVTLDNLKNISVTKKSIHWAQLVVVCSTSRCRYEIELIEFLLSIKQPYVKIEFDYNFCVRRNIICTVDRKISSCCDTKKFHLYRKLFAKAKLNIFQSPKHYQSHYEFYGEAISNYSIKPPTVSVEDLQPSKFKDEDSIPFFGDLNFLKGGKAYVAYAKAHPDKTFPVYGKNQLRESLPENISFHEPVSNKEVLGILGQTKTFICQPVWPEPSGRLAAEAFLSGCNILGNDRIGTFSFDFYPDNKPKAIEEMKAALHDFWLEVEAILNTNKQPQEISLGQVLVYKSYGGLGDIFFAIPAINKLAAVSSSLSFAVAPRLVSFFSKHLKNINIINEEVARLKEDNFDHIFELGNYPAFRGYDLPHALKYPTHKKVKQHAIQHYIDTVSKLHISIDNSYKEYPFFKQQKTKGRKYFTVHHGAGFLLKIWPTEKYAQLIETLAKLFPYLDCKIIMGPNDPAIEPYFSKPMSHISYITGDMNEVGEALSGALFHIGNDAGITHVAGAYNIPTVGIYGPTGPGSWGNFAQYNELIWGKKGVCNVRCNYDVILNCEHKICLNSVTVNRVLEALYKVLQKAYSNEKSILKTNPQAILDFGKNDCLIKLYDNEFLLEYHNKNMKLQVETLLKKECLMDSKDDNMKLVLDVLIQQQVVFYIPNFQKHNNATCQEIETKTLKNSINTQRN